MCGITGILDGLRGDRISAAMIDTMRDTMVHRGPDGRGTWLSEDGRVGFGHRRLSIIDLSAAGRQPMCNEDGNIWLTYNGEIYNHLALRKELLAAGHVYRSQTDTETLIHAYEEWGLGCLHRIEGMFAFALWDGRSRQLFLVRDRIGIKPLYYTAQAGQVIFGSEIKAILAHPDVPREVSYPAVYHYLTFLTPPAPLTMFDGIYKVPAGCYLEVSQTGQLQANEYWDLADVPQDEASTTDEGACVDHIRDLLRHSIGKRMMSDVPYGVFLSGGIDSSLNVALMSELTARPVRTFTVGFQTHEQFNELDYARRVAQRFQTDHHEVLIGESDAMDYLPQMVQDQDEPIADWVCIPLHFVSQLARQSGTIVVQVGEGSDEQFCGYPGYMRYLRGSYRRVWQATHGRAPIAFSAAAGFRLLAAVADPRFRQFAELADRARHGKELFWGGAICYWPHLKERVLGKGPPGTTAGPASFKPEAFDTLDSERVVEHYYDRLRQRRPQAELVERMAYQEFKLRLPELLLMRVDKITMGTSVEARVPFLDHELVSFTRDIPQAVKVRKGITKHILKKACDGILPDDIIYRKKMGFAAPVSDWMLGEFGHHVEEEFMTSSLHDHGWFDLGFVSWMFAQHRQRRQDWSLHLWLLYNLSSWYDHWIGSRAVRV